MVPPMTSATQYKQGGGDHSKYSIISHTQKHHPNMDELAEFEMLEAMA